MSGSRPLGGDSKKMKRRGAEQDVCNRKTERDCMLENVCEWGDSVGLQAEKADSGDNARGGMFRIREGSLERGVREAIDVDRRVYGWAG